MSEYVTRAVSAVLQDGGEEPIVTIAFVGSKLHFPDCLLRLVSSEIEGVAVTRAATPFDLSDAASVTSDAEHLIVIDESFTNLLEPDLLARLKRGERTFLAVAYRDPTKVGEIIHCSDDELPVISLLPMGLNIESWLTIVRLLLTGYPFIPTELVMRFGQNTLQNGPVSTEMHNDQGILSELDKLTVREREVLGLVAEGLQNKHIANKLRLSEHTVKLHLHHVISKLGARNRTDAAMRYRANLVA